MKKYFVSALALLGMVIVICEASPALAALDCSTGSKAIFFDAGYESYSNYFDDLWEDYGDCYRVEDFLLTLNPPVPSSSTSALLQCFQEGRIIAYSDKVRAKAIECVVDCHYEGALLGQSFGRDLCGLEVLAISYSGETVCQITFEAACRANYKFYVRTHCPHREDEINYSYCSLPTT